MGLLVPLVCLYAGCASTDDATRAAGEETDAARSGGELVPDAGADSGAEARRLACIRTDCSYPYATCQSADGTFSDRCGVNRLTDRNNCGECDHVCPTWDEPTNAMLYSVLHLTTECIDGACKRKCYNRFSSDNFEDCNGVVDDGCETNLLTDVDNCGSCGNKCADICTKGHCGCPFPKTYCPGAGCVDTFTDMNHCGGCNSKCTVPPDSPPPGANQLWTCVDGECPKLACVNWGYWRDCNGRPDDGCEADVSADVDNCGDCGNKCKPGQVCAYDTVTFGPKCLCPEGETRCSTPTTRSIAPTCKPTRTTAEAAVPYVQDLSTDTTARRTRPIT